MPAFISLENIKKQFGKALILKEINLAIKEKKIFALLGLNGAGKTTLIKCLLGVIKPTCGEIYFKAKPLTFSAIQRYFGYLPESFQLYKELSARELLSALNRSLNNRPQEIVVTLERVGLKHEERKKIKFYSRGMLQRLGLAVCLLKNPEVIVLDEPLSGLDPLGQAQILKLLKELNISGKTIFFSSHILSQVEKIAHEIGIIHQGRLCFLGDTGEFSYRHRSSSLEEAFLKEIGNEKINSTYLA